jgi:hypothetical protein
MTGETQPPDAPRPPPRRRTRSGTGATPPEPDITYRRVSPYFVQGPVDERIRERMAAHYMASARARERTRALMAGISLLLVFVTVIMAWVSTWAFHSDWSNAESWLQAVLPAETAIVGSAIGFYFGERRSDRTRSTDDV